MNPNDRIRQLMLRYFYDRNASASQLLGGRDGVAVKLEAAQKDLQKLHNLSASEVTSNMTYLQDRGWIGTLERRSTHKDYSSTGYGSTFEGVSVYYLITARGIDRIEGSSEFEVKDRFAGINITATGSNVITLGDGNVVNVKHADLHAELGRLKDAIASNDRLAENEKFDLVVDVESIKDQLAKARPSTTIIRHLWAGIEAAVTAVGLFDAVQRVRPLLERIL